MSTLCSIRKQQFKDFKQDAIVVNQHDSLVIGNEFIDTCALESMEYANSAHRDAIQLIPPTPKGNRAQFAGATLNNVSIYANSIYSEGKLQGVFASDGLFRNLNIVGNTIDTKGQHFIAINGMLSGLIDGNVRKDGSFCPIVLGPLRLAGNAGEGSVWVLGFNDNRFRYAPISEITRTRSPEEKAVVLDYRSSPIRRTGDIYLTKFDMSKFRDAFISAPVPTSVLEHMRIIKTLALKFGVSC